MSRRLKAAEELVNAATAVMKDQGITPIVEMLEGPAAQAVLEVARTRRCDLIVMGRAVSAPLVRCYSGWSVRGLFMRRPARCC